MKKKNKYPNYVNLFTSRLKEDKKRKSPQELAMQVLKEIGEKRLKNEKSKKTKK